jgi:hypothetical protein
MKLMDILKEKIVIDVEIGDTILTGKFKNKKTKVASIGTDDHGMPIINGRKATTFRMTKKSDLKFSREQLKEMSNEKRAFLMLRIYGDSWKVNMGKVFTGINKEKPGMIKKGLKEIKILNKKIEDMISELI